MRYTTVIDITEMPALYRNHNARLVYLHLCLRCGYHDEDRDVINTSIRRLAGDIGITVAAVRHALNVLEASKLIERQGTVWNVRKWLPQQTVTPRPTGKGKKDTADAVAERQRIEREREQKQAQKERERAELEAMGKTNFMVWFEAQEAKAAQGDIEAKKTCERNRQVYEQHAAAVKQTKDKKK